MTIIRNYCMTMTAVERLMGRYMRAPDGHEGEAAPAVEAKQPTSEEGQELGRDGLPVEKKTTEKLLEEEFGQVETPAPEDGTDDGEKDADAGDEGDDEGDKPKEVAEGKKNRTQERIDELTAARREAEAKAAEAARQAEYWRGVAEGKAPPKEDAKGEAEDSDAEPDASKYEFGEADPKYIKDLAKHEARMEVRTEAARAKVQAEVAQMEANWQTGVAEATGEYDDFNEVVVKGAEEQKWACPPVVSLGIKQSKVGAHVAYHLAKNSDEAKRIADLHPFEQAREFGRLEMKIEMERGVKTAPAEEGKPKPRAVTSAPPPPKSQSRGAGGQFKVAADTDDFAAFEGMADEVLKKAN